MNANEVKYFYIILICISLEIAFYLASSDPLKYIMSICTVIHTATDVETEIPNRRAKLK